ncbi:MAG: glycosyltransferase [Candidatus Omnitrophica bacterium]|nr:glycosyltransferase [Candidatus Omnitrophota bacterium]
MVISREPFVSIIIPFKEDSSKIRECVRECKKLNYINYEIILLPDASIEEKEFFRCKIIPTGVVTPAAKRNIGIKNARGEICAFSDADAYPDRDWLKNAILYLNNDSIAILGGPNLTPPDNNLLQKIIGDVLGSRVGMWNVSIRYSIRKAQNTDLLQSCNMIIPKRTFSELGHGWDETLITGEDAKLCYEVRELGKKLRYVPDVINYHHRRNTLLSYLKQIWGYARDQAFVLKERRKIDRPLIFVPSLFVLWFAFGPFLFMLPAIDFYMQLLYIITASLYLIVIALGCILRNIKRAPLMFILIISTHISYGLGFLRGFLFGKPCSTKRTKTCH